MDTFTKVAELLASHLGIDAGSITLESEIGKGSTFILEFKKIVLWKKY